MNTTAVATISDGRRSVLIDMASRFGMEPAAFEATLRATVVPKDCNREQFAAFLLVAKEYNLNPLTKEIYAFPTRSGGIQPIVSIDGWANLINSHSALDGIEFDDHPDESGKSLAAITCRIWRKDREKPIVVTEYMAECARSTDPWKQWPRRMLRHKSLIQCARYAFGFAGIVDPDEAERMDVSTVHDVTPRKRPPAPMDHEPAQATTTEPETEAQETVDRSGAEQFISATREHIRKATDPKILADWWKSQEQGDARRAHKLTNDEVTPLKDYVIARCKQLTDEGMDIPADLDRRAKKPTATPLIDDPEKMLAWVDSTLAAVTEADNIEAIWNAAIDRNAKGCFPPDYDEAQALRRKHEQRLSNG